MLVEGWGASWELRRPSIWRREIDICEAGHELPFAKYVGRRWSGDGTFELPKGVRLILHHNPWKGFSSVETTHGESLFVLESRVFKPDRVILGNRTDLLAQWPWTLAIPWTLLLQRRRRTR